MPFIFRNKVKVLWLISRLMKFDDLSFWAELALRANDACARVPYRTVLVTKPSLSYCKVL